MAFAYAPKTKDTVRGDTLVFEIFGDFFAFDVVELGKKFGVVLLGYAVDVIIQGARNNVKMYVIHLELILLHKRPVVLAHVAAVAQLTNNFLLNKKYQFKNTLQLFWGQLPRLLNMPLRNDQKMAGHLARITQNYLSIRVLFEDTLLGFTKRTITKLFCHDFSITA